MELLGIKLLASQLFGICYWQYFTLTVLSVLHNQTHVCVDGVHLVW